MTDQGSTPPLTRGDVTTDQSCDWFDATGYDLSIFHSSHTIVKGWCQYTAWIPWRAAFFVKLTTFGAILRGRGEPQLLLRHLSARPTYNQVYLRQTKLISDKTKLLWRSQVQLRQNLVHMTKPSPTEKKQSLIWGKDETGIHLPSRLNTCLQFKWEARQVWQMREKELGLKKWESASYHPDPCRWPGLEWGEIEYDNIQ